MITILYGKDGPATDWQLSRIRQKYDPEQIQDFDLEQEEEASFWEAVDTPDLFAPEKLVIARNASFLSARDKTHYKLEGLEKHFPLQADLVLVCPAEKLDKRKKATKLFLEKGKAIECLSLNAKSQPGLIAQLAKEKGIKWDRTTQQWFAAHVGLDAMRIDHELDKLALYSKQPTFEDVQELTSTEPLDNIFGMTDALFDKNGLRLLAFFRNYRQMQMEPVALTLILATHVRFLFQVRVLADAGNNEHEIASALKAKPYRVSQNLKKAARMDADSLMDMLSDLADLDQKLKSGKMNQDECFEQYCLDMIR